MTRPPLILVGATSAEYTGTVTSFRPIPIPSRMRVTMSSFQFWVTAMPIGESRENTAPMKMVLRRPSRWFRGSQIHPALWCDQRDQQRHTSYRYLQQKDSEVRAGVDESDKPLVILTDTWALGCAWGIWTLIDAKRQRKGQIGSIRPGLIPALDGSSN